MYLEELFSEVKSSPENVFIGMCVFCVVLMGTSVRHVASTCFGILVVYSFYHIRSWKAGFTKLSKNEKALIASFALYALSGVIAYINVQDVHEYTKMLERYLRFLLAVPIYLVIRERNISVINYLYVGAIVSGPFLLLVVLVSYFENPSVPAHGHYHHIIFGSVAMLNVGVMLSLLLMVKVNNLYKIIIFISILCGLAAVVLSQSRGVWLVLPFYGLVVLYYSIKYSRIKISSVIILCLFIFSVMQYTKVGDMVNKRIDHAVNEVESFYNEGNYMTSLGTRLAMWEIGIDVWKEHPIIGTGPGDFDEIVIQLQEEGQYKGMRVFASTHNIYVQALVNAGLVGFIAMIIALFIFPFKMIVQSRITYPVKSLTGLVFLLLFAIVGISESWTLRLPSVTVYIIFAIVILSSVNLVSNKDDT